MKFEKVDRRGSAPVSTRQKPALMLSGGGKLGNYHYGVIRALLDEGLLPKIISGSSAGSIAAAIVGTRTEPELSDLLHHGVERLASDEGFENEARPLILEQTRVSSLLAEIIPDVTLAEARTMSGRSIDIVVAHFSGDGGVVLNADNAPDVLVRDAVMASCAVPMIYAPVKIRQRDAKGEITLYPGDRSWIDGSVYADLPADWLRDHYGADFLIASLINPIELPFATDPAEHGPLFDAAARLGMSWCRTVGSMAITLSRPLLQAVPAAERMLTLTQSVLDQRLDADVLILPAPRFNSPFDIMTISTASEMAEFMAAGERAARLRMSAIGA